MNQAIRPLIFGMLLLPLAVSGCTDVGAGRTGEYVVPAQRLRQIEAFDPDRLPALGPATTQPLSLSATRPAEVIEELPVTLEQVRQWAIQNNLRLKVDLLEPSIVRETVSVEQARFEAVFSTSATYGTTDTPFFVTDQQGNRRIAASGSDFFSVTPSVLVPLISGGVLEFRVPMNRVENSTGRIDVNTGLPVSDLQYTSDFTLLFSQPLLRNAGTDASLAGIRVAFYRYQQTEARTKLAVITVLADASRQFWRLDSALKLLQVQRQRYDSAVDQLRRAQRRLDAGVGVQADTLSAEAALAEATSAIVAAESLVRGELRELKRIINAPDLDLNSPILLRPAADPRFLAVRLDADALAGMAVRDRMEILDAELQMLAEAVNVRLARNQLLPLLDLQYRYNVNGLGGSFNDSFDLLTDNEFADHSIGLNLQIPLGNQAARSRLRQSLARRQQALANRQVREQNVRAEVYLAVQNLEQSWQAILAARQRVFTEAQVLESEIRKFDRGENDSQAVRLARDRLTSAQDQEIRAVRDYQISQIDLAVATGTLLGAANVDWAPVEPAK